VRRFAAYGIDAPGVVLAHVVGGAVLALLASVGPASLVIAAAFGSALLLSGAAVMLTSSLLIKKRVSER